ncbi:MAG: hypothetical protein OQK73_12195 [Gammaproteobacteria bacterium]|nr:hypothetical protein [Gammaproteobacteria bacterium]
MWHDPVFRAGQARGTVASPSTDNTRIGLQRDMGLTFPEQRRELLSTGLWEKEQFKQQELNVFLKSIRN